MYAVTSFKHMNTVSEHANYQFLPILEAQTLKMETIVETGLNGRTVINFDIIIYQLFLAHTTDMLQ